MAESNNKRIAKNTLLLYIRMLFLMAVTLYTSRVILEKLGVEDFGIYNVVGGVVAFAGLFTSTMGATTSRFITFSLGKNDFEYQSRVFSTSVTIQLVVAIIVIVLAESIGVWFLNTHMNIPSTRMTAANWVLQCSIFSFALGLLSVPYNASIIAHEKMSIYAYASIVEVTLKLLTALALSYSPFDRLIVYAVFLLCIAIIMRVIYGVYCTSHFVESKFKFVYDKNLLSEMFGFAGWTVVGTSAQVFISQGINIITNIFFDVTLNAARGVASHVENAVRQFVNNFMTALNPQITKSYAKGDFPYMMSLVYKGTKYSYFLVLMLAIPFLFEADTILNIWLKNPPAYSALFVRWTILIILADVLSNTIMKANAASGKVKKYQLVVGGVNLSIFPITYICFYIGLPAVTSYMVHFTIFFLNLFVRIRIMKGIVPITYADYIKNVLLRIFPISFISLIIPYFIITQHDADFFRLLMICVVSVVEVPLLAYFLGLNANEKYMVNKGVKKMICKIRH